MNQPAKQKHFMNWQGGFLEVLNFFNLS